MKGNTTLHKDICYVCGRYDETSTLYILVYVPRIRNVRHSQEEQPALRMLTEASADASVTPAPTGCFISMSTDYFSTIAHRPFFNDENNERKINGVLFQENFYNQASAPSKLLKLKIHPSVEQMQRIFSTHLPVEQNASLSFTPSAIRYSYGYYVYELKHILI